MNQLIANVSSVPSVRQLTALSTDLVCVSAPRNDKATRCASLADDDRTDHAAATVPARRMRVLGITNGHSPRIRAFCTRKSSKRFEFTEYSRFILKHRRFMA
jgi:hypothetical protein